MAAFHGRQGPLLSGGPAAPVAETLSLLRSAAGPASRVQPPSESVEPWGRWAGGPRGEWRAPRPRPRL